MPFGTGHGLQNGGSGDFSGRCVRAITVDLSLQDDRFARTLLRCATSIGNPLQGCSVSPATQPGWAMKISYVAVLALAALSASRAYAGDPLIDLDVSIGASHTATDL